MPSFARYAYWLLLTIWTAIFAGFWAVIFLGGELLEWFLTGVLHSDAQATTTMINILQSVGAGGLFFIWAMGAFALYIAKRLMWASITGVGSPDTVHLANDGTVIDGSARDTTDELK